MMEPLVRLGVRELRRHFADVLNRVGYGGERSLLQRRGRDLAVLVPLNDLRRLEELDRKLADGTEPSGQQASKFVPPKLDLDGGRAGIRNGWAGA